MNYEKNFNSKKVLQCSLSIINCQLIKYITQTSQTQGVDQVKQNITLPI